MSHTCHSKIVIGVDLGLEILPVQKTFNRFDPKTGEPKEHTGTIYNATLIWNGKRVQLPEDDETIEEYTLKQRSWGVNEYDYVHRNLNNKLYEFMTKHGAEEDPVENDLTYWVNRVSDLHPLDRRDQSDTVILGITVAEGSSSRPVVEVKDFQALLETYKERFFAESLEIQNKFGGELFDAKVFLMT